MKRGRLRDFAGLSLPRVLKPGSGDPSRHRGQDGQDAAERGAAGREREEPRVADARVAQARVAETVAVARPHAVIAPRSRSATNGNLNACNDGFGRSFGTVLPRK